MGWTQTASKGGSGNFEKCPPGNHPAVLVALIDMGHQKQNYQGEDKWQHRAFFVWEAVHEKGVSLIGIDLTVSLNEKSKLRKWIEARQGKAIPDGMDYDVSKELGKGCLLNVIQKGDWPKIEGVTALPSAIKAPTPKNTPISMTLDDIRAGKSIPSWIPYLYGQSLIERVRGSQEYVGGGSTMTDPDPEDSEQTSGSPESDEQIPF